MYDTAIIDYETSNLKSVISACKFAKMSYIITNDIKKIKDSKSLIIPGVGSFKSAINYLRKKKLDLIILDFYKKNKPILGICLGMQIFFNSSEESKNIKGLSLIKRQVKKFHPNTTKKIPLIGWTKIIGNFKNSLVRSNKDKNYYFFHLFYINFFKKKNFKIFYSYNGKKKFCSYIEHKNLFLMQFHPEKSGIKGLEIYKNFKKKIEN